MRAWGQKKGDTLHSTKLTKKTAVTASLTQNSRGLSSCCQRRMRVGATAVIIVHYYWWVRWALAGSRSNPASGNRGPGICRKYASCPHKACIYWTATHAAMSWKCSRRSGSSTLSSALASLKSAAPPPDHEDGCCAPPCSSAGDDCCCANVAEGPRMIINRL